LRKTTVPKLEIRKKSSPFQYLPDTSACFFHRNLRLQNQAHENPLDEEQDEEGIAEVSPLFVDPRQQKVESKTSVSQLPQDGQST
jgi:hypothetical protein